jgi:hypothetical protein
LVRLGPRTLGKGEEVDEGLFQLECTTANLAGIEAQFFPKADRRKAVTRAVSTTFRNWRSSSGALASI